jgi:tape measure domain-containing protein
MAANDSIVLGIKTEDRGAAAGLIQALEKAGPEARDALLNALGDKAGKKASLQLVIKPAFEGEDLDKVFKGWNYSLQETGSLQDELAKKAERLQGIEKGSLTNLRALVNTYKQQRDALSPTLTATDGLGRRVNVVNQEWANANAKVEKFSRLLNIAGASNFWDRIKAELNLGPLLAAGRAVSDLVNTFQSLSIIFGQVQGVFNTFIDSLGRIQQVDLLFRSIGQGPADVATVFSDSTKIALTYGTSLNVIREGFAQLTPAVVAAGGNINDVSGIVAALSSRFAVFGLGADKTQRIMNGVIQAFGKGKLMAEELNQQIAEADPAFRIDLVNALNKLDPKLKLTTAGLGEMVKNGELTNDVLLKVLPAMGKTSSTFGALGKSALSASVALLRNAVTVEQVKNQIATLNQLNLESLANLFKPLLGSFLAIQAAVTDFTTDILKLEVTRTLIEIFNNLAIVIAATTVAITKLITIVGAVLNPFFGLINAVDGLLGGLIGLRPIVTLIGVIIAANLTRTLLTAALSFKAVSQATLLFGNVLKSTAIGSVAGFRTAILGLTTILNGNFLDGLKGFANGIGGFNFQLGKTKGAAGAAKGATSEFSNILGLLPGAYADAVIAQEAFNNGSDKQKNNLDKQGKAAGGATKATQGIATATGDAAVAAGGAASLFGLSATALAALAVTAAVSVAAWSVYEKSLKSAWETGETLKAGLKSIKQELENQKTALASTADGTDTFAKELKTAKGEVNSIKAGLLAIAKFVFPVFTVFVKSDVDTVADIANNLGEVKTVLKEVDIETNKVTTDLKKYNSETASEKTTALLKARVTAQLQSYDLIIQKLGQVRQEKLKEAKSTGGGVSQQEAKALNQLSKTLDEAKAKREALRKEAESKGINITVNDTELKIGTQSLALLQERIKTLKATKAEATIGTKGYKEAEAQIKSLEGLLKLLESDPTEVRIKVNYDISKGQLESAVSQAQALVEQFKARQDLIESGYDIIKAEIGARITAAKDELDVLKDRKASSGAIKAKEEEIEALKKQADNVERAGLVNRLNSLGQAQKLEQEVLRLKQQQAALDIQNKVREANIKLNEAQQVINQAEAERNKAVSRGVSGEALQGYQRNVDLARENYGLQLDILNAEKSRLNSLRQTQSIETETLGIKQKTEEVTLRSKVAQLDTAKATAQTAVATGLISNATQAVSSGFIQVGDQVKQLPASVQAASSSIQASAATATAAVLGSAEAYSRVSAGANAATSATAALAGNIVSSSDSARSSVGQLGDEIGGVAGEAARASSGFSGISSAAQAINTQRLAELKATLSDSKEEASNVAAELANTGSVGGALASSIQPFTNSISATKDATNTLSDSISKLPTDAAAGLSDSFEGAAISAGLIASADIGGSVGAATRNSGAFRDSMLGAEGAVDGIRSKLLELDGLTVNVKVGVEGGVPARWAGGPVSAGTMYRVNELGKESFLSAGGRLSVINRPENSTWRPPTSGTIIPAHLTAALDIPRGGIKLPSGASSRLHRASRATGGSRNVSDAVKAIAVNMDTGYLARSQATQAQQLGKLTMAINELTRKNWNVDVKVRNTGSTAYLDALNQRL